MMYTMALPKNPTNFDLLLELKDVKNIAIETRVLAKKTNSRTDKLEDRTDKIETWQERLQAIEDYKLRHKKSPQSLVVQVVTILGTALGIIYILVEALVGK